MPRDFIAVELYAKAEQFEDMLESGAINEGEYLILMNGLRTQHDVKDVTNWIRTKEQSLYDYWKRLKTNDENE